MNITVERKQDGYHQEVWDFDFLDYHGCYLLVLRSYAQRTRPTKRHKWITQQSYDRFERTRASYEGIQDAATVPLPQDVQQEAVSQIKIEVAKEIRKEK